MDFHAEIKRYTVAEIMRAIRCQQRTAYSWISSEKSPHPWAQRLVIREMQRVTGRRK